MQNEGRPWARLHNSGETRAAPGAAEGGRLVIRVALADDDSQDRALLADYLARWGRELGQELQVRAYADGASLVADYRADQDVLLLDIEMPGLDGLAAAQAIRRVDPAVILLFITNAPQFAAGGYRVDALDYLVKPVSYFAFSQRMTKALQRMARRESVFLPVLLRDGTARKVDAAELLYIEVLDHDLIYHTVQGPLAARGRLRDVEAALDPQVFFRCHKSYLVNLDHVSGVQGYEVQVGSHVLPVGRPRRRALLDALNRFIQSMG